MDVICLRPKADFTRVGVVPPATLAIDYRDPAEPELGALLREARALVIPAVGPKLAPELFAGTRLALVQVTGAGVDRLDEQAMRHHGIAVANVPGGSNSAVAEYVVTSASMLLRRLAWSDAEIKAGRYQAFRGGMIAANLPGLHGLTVGIIGLGTIGIAVARLLQAFGCRLVYHDPAPKDLAVARELGMQAMSLDDLLAAADVVSLHVPLVAATRGMIGAAQLARMKRGAILIHAARGGIVDEAALAATLASGHLGGAAVDVYSTEPPDSANPLLDVGGEAKSRLLLTPHVAGVTLQAWQILFRNAWENVERVLLRGEAARHRVY